MPGPPAGAMPAAPMGGPMPAPMPLMGPGPPGPRPMMMPGGITVLNYNFTCLRT